MIANEKKSLNELQTMLLEMLAWFHGFCQKNKIRYYILGGTMLGAIRHGGFIPWDDDIDVGIPRKDYEKLLRNKEEYLADEPRYVFESYLDGNKDFEFEFTKLYDTTTTLIENRRTRICRGIYIDVFPLDGIGDSKEEACSNYAPIKHLLDIYAIMTCTLRKGRSIYKNLAIILSYIIPRRFLCLNQLVRHINTLCAQRDFDSHEYVGNLMGTGRYKDIMPRMYFGEPTLYKFESLEVYGVQDYKSFLTNVYGNWEQLPPLSKRKSEHGFLYINLKKAYR